MLRALLLITLFFASSAYACFDFQSCCEQRDSLASIIVERVGARDCSSARPKLKSIKKLILRDKSLTNVSALRDLTELEVLDLSYNHIQELWPLEDLAHLRVLKINSRYDSPIKLYDIWSLSHLIRLARLELIGQEISDLSPVASLGNLRSIDLSGNLFIEDFSILRSLLLLEDFRFRCIERMVNGMPKICERSPLDYNLIGELKGLKRLDLSYNNLESAAFLKASNKLQFVDLRSNPIKDISIIRTLIPAAIILHDNGAEGRSL